MNARQASHVRYGIKYARDVQPLLAALGPGAFIDFAVFGPKEKLMRRAYMWTVQGKEHRRAERLVRGKAHRQYLRRHGMDA